MKISKWFKKNKEQFARWLFKEQVDEIDRFKMEIYTQTFKQGEAIKNLDIAMTIMAKNNLKVKK